MEVGKGFLELQEDYSRRSSLHPTISLGETSNSAYAYTTRLGCCGCCTLKVERDEGSLRVGRLSLAPYCHLALLVFGFCFLLAGAVLTWLSYSPNINLDVKHAPLISSPQIKGGDSHEERIAGPLFLVVGSCLLVLGVGLAILGCKLENAAARQRSALSRFSFESGPRSVGDIFANLDDIRSQGGDSHRRGSFFGSSYNPSTRRSTLSTIAQAVPLGFFMMESPRTPKSPNDTSSNLYNNNGQRHSQGIVNPNSSATNINTTKLSDEFQEVELGSPTRDDDEFTLPALSLRPSIIPIPMFVSPNRRMSHGLEAMQLPSRSDEPFGSIASMGLGKDIASFPAPRSRPSINISMTSDQLPPVNGLPPISVMETGNALTASPKQGEKYIAKPPLRASKSEDHTREGDDSLSVMVSGGSEPQKRPHSGS